MKNTLALVCLVALGILVTACSTVEYKYVGAGREAIKNVDGHVVGQKEMLRDAETGEQYEHVNFPEDIHQRREFPLWHRREPINPRLNKLGREFSRAESLSGPMAFRAFARAFLTNSWSTIRGRLGARWKC